MRVMLPLGRGKGVGVSVMVGVAVGVGVCVKVGVGVGVSVGVGVFARLGMPVARRGVMADGVNVGEGDGADTRTGEVHPPNSHVPRTSKESQTRRIVRQ